MKSRLPHKADTTEMEAEALPEAFMVNGRGLPPKVFTLRQKRYRKAKAEPKFRFYALYDRIYRHDVLAAAWVLIARNDGAPGVDGISIDDVERRSDGMLRFLGKIQESLRTKAYRPQASTCNVAAQKGFRLPDDPAWCWYFTKRVGLVRISGGLPTGER